MGFNMGLKGLKSGVNWQGALKQKRHKTRAGCTGEAKQIHSVNGESDGTVR
jgi:hypothetical protein